MNSRGRFFTRKKIYVCLLSGMALLVVGFPITIRYLTSHPTPVKKFRAWWEGAEYLGEEGVIQQQTPYGCGIACLEMVLKRKGLPAGSEVLRAESRTTDTGTSLYGMELAAKAHDLDASTWRLGIGDLSRIPLPSIAFIDGSHFVVVSEVEEDGCLVVLDPARGKLRFRPEAFERRWKGETLVIGKVPPGLLGIPKPAGGVAASRQGLAGKAFVPPVVQTVHTVTSPNRKEKHS